MKLILIHRRSGYLLSIDTPSFSRLYRSLDSIARLRMAPLGSGQWRAVFSWNNSVLQWEFLFSDGRG